AAARSRGCPPPCVRRTVARKSTRRSLARFLLGGLGLSLARRDGLGAVLAREALDAAFRVQQLLTTRVERVARRADLEVQLLVGGPGLPGRPARAAGLDLVVLG